MKAQRCVSPLQAVMGVLEGKITKHEANAEATQVLMYLDRLQQLVPECPKDRPISRLELIQSVIDYICDLEDKLALPLNGAQQPQQGIGGVGLGGGGGGDGVDAEIGDDNVFEDNNNIQHHNIQHHNIQYHHPHHNNIQQQHHYNNHHNHHVAKP